MTDEKPKPETLDFLLDYTKDVPAEQAGASKNVDSKAIQVFTGATIVVGLAAAGGFRGGSAWLIGFAVGAYVVVAALVALILKPRGFRHSKPVDQLWSEHWDEGVSDIKHAVIADLSDGYTENVAILKTKNRLLRYAILAASVEAILVGVALILSLANPANPALDEAGRGAGHANSPSAMASVVGLGREAGSSPALTAAAVPDAQGAAAQTLSS